MYPEYSDDGELRYSSGGDCLHLVLIWDVDDEVPTGTFLTASCTTNDAVVASLKNAKLQLTSAASVCHSAILTERQNNNLLSVTLPRTWRLSTRKETGNLKHCNIRTFHDSIIITLPAASVAASIMSHKFYNKYHSLQRWDNNDEMEAKSDSP